MSFNDKEVVAIDTTYRQQQSDAMHQPNLPVASDTANPSGGSGDRTASLAHWLKRTQEVLAFRSLQGSSFSRLYNLLRCKRLVELALGHVLSNAGARTAGVDGVTRKRLLETPDAYDQLCDEIWRELCAKTYRPAPVRRVYIPKPNGEQRPLGIPTLKDRVVQEMLRLLLEPIYEAKFHRHSYGFRPFRSTHHAAVRIKDLMGRRGYTVAIEGDIRKCFDRIHHVTLLRILRKTITDERIIRLVKQMLRAGVMEDGAWHVSDEGTPQGGIVSPLLANIYLNELDQFIAGKWEALTDGERNRHRRHHSAVPCQIVRYADDFVVMVLGTEADAQRLKAEMATFLDHELHLELSDAKTLVTRADHGIDFLGFHIRKYPRATLITPSRKAKSRFRQQVRTRAWEGFSCDAVVGVVTLNRYLIGWGMYYRRVNSARAFKSLDHYVWQRVWKLTRRLSGGRRRPTPAQHRKRHYIPYRFDLNRKNRRRGGGHYGAWADTERTTAYIVVKLSFLPIRYVDFHPQLNPYVPGDRVLLEQKHGLTALLAELRRNPSPLGNKEYGAEWPVLRRAVLTKAGHRCERCKRLIQGRQAHVHHLLPLKQAQTRRQANLLDHLIALCPACHARAEREQLHGEAGD